MKPAITVIDYGIGNLLSVCRAIEHCGAEAVLSGSAATINSAERLILPGVGAFRDGMLGLQERGLIEPIRKYCASDRPFLGICLGMQMMMGSSEEFGLHEGLGLVPGTVTAIPGDSAGISRKIPHIGWSTLRTATGGDWTSTILDGLEPGVDSAYFVHSYAAAPENPAHSLAECLYDGHRIAAVIRSGNRHGCQFHPEKSGETGLAIIRNFCGL